MDHFNFWHKIYIWERNRLRLAFCRSAVRHDSWTVRSQDHKTLIAIIFVVLTRISKKRRVGDSLFGCKYSEMVVSHSGCRIPRSLISLELGLQNLFNYFDFWHFSFDQPIFISFHESGAILESGAIVFMKNIAILEIMVFSVSIKATTYCFSIIQKIYFRTCFETTVKDSNIQKRQKINFLL